MAQRKSKPIDPADKPFPWEPMLETSVFDAPWKKAAKRAVRTVVPSTPRETANELFLAALGGPVGAAVSKGATRVASPAIKAIGKHLNPPFSSSMRQTLETFAGKPTIENIRRRNILGGDPHGPRGLWREASERYFDKGGDLDRSEWLKTSDMLARTYETRSKKSGILGDLIEHGNILARKIREETAKEAGASVEKASRASAKARWGVDSGDEDLGKLIDNILRRLGVGGKR